MAAGVPGGRLRRQRLRKEGRAQAAAAGAGALAPSLVRALIEEARLGAQLSHKNLVQVHQLGVAEGATTW